MIDTIGTIALAAIAAILAITLHEAAHGYAALALGDTTARDAHRLSLNPLRHIDPVGTLLLPGRAAGRPVADVRAGDVHVRLGEAGAGGGVEVPRSAARHDGGGGGRAGDELPAGHRWARCCCRARPELLPGVFAYLDRAAAAHPILSAFLVPFILYNLVLGLFNLLPIPPLDGGRIAVGLLPLALARVWARLERAGIVIVLLVVFLLPALLGEFGIRFDPFRAALGRVLPWALRLVLGLTGHHMGPPMHEQFL